MLDGGNIVENFKFDDNGDPFSTASGNMADIVCDYGKFALAVEVTMQSGQKQYEMEWYEKIRSKALDWLAS